MQRPCNTHTQALDFNGGCERNVSESITRIEVGIPAVPKHPLIFRTNTYTRLHVYTNALLCSHHMKRRSLWSKRCYFATTVFFFSFFRWMCSSLRVMMGCWGKLKLRGRRVGCSRTRHMLIASRDASDVPLFEPRKRNR